MSFSAHRRDAFDKMLPLNYRASHARSCAVHVAQKYKLRRSEIIDLVRKKCGVDLMTVETEQELELAVDVLNKIRLLGLDY